MTKRQDINFPLLFDGAMGTYYQEIGKNPLPSCEMANLFDRDTILQIHKEYVEAGAQAIKTNTYHANIHALDTDFSVVEKIIISAIDLAKEATKDTDVLVFASIGCIGPAELVDIEEYKDIIDIFFDQGINNFLFETYENIGHLPELARYIKERDNDAFVITSFAIDGEGQSREGRNGSSLISEASNVYEIDAVGFNCVSGPLRLREYIETIEFPNKLVSIMPNGGYPTVINGKTIYSTNKEYFANYALKFLDYGVDIIGGCCGTTPAFIKEIADKLPDYKIQEIQRKNLRSAKLDTPYADNLFRKKLENGKKPIAVEFDPPKDLDMARYMEDVKKLAKSDVDAITIADCPVARVRVDASLTAYKIKNEVGIDPIVHMTCRDRNLNATKALLLGLNVEDILNIIVVTGDPIPTAERDEIKSVYQFNSRKLARFVDKMNENTFSNPMYVGAALNINSRRFDLELRRAKEKEKEGVNVFYTQPVISEDAVENIKTAKEELKSYIMGGIMPVVSYRNALFLDAEVSGISVDDQIINMYKDVSKEEADQLAVDLAYDFSKKIEDHVDGYYLITPFDRTDIIIDLVEKIKA